MRDLTQVFTKQYETSPRKAKWKFSWSVINYFRPDFIQSFKNHQPNLYRMYKSYFKGFSKKSVKEERRSQLIQYFTFVAIIIASNW